MQWSQKPLILFLILPIALIIGWASVEGAFWTGVFFATVYLIFATMTKYVMFDD